MTPRFTAEARAQLNEVAETLDEWEGFLGDYDTFFRERFEPDPDPLDPALSTKDKVRLLALSALAYTRQLAWAIVKAVNTDATPSLYLATRAHLEMTGLVAYLLWKLRQFDRTSVTEDGLLDFLDRLILGKRHGADTLAADLAQRTRPIGVMDLVDAVDRIFDQPELKGRFRDGYGWLSEFCHPNSYSRFATQRLDGRTMFFDKVPRLAAKDAGVAIGYAALSHGIFFDCYEQIVTWVGGMPTGEAEQSKSDGEGRP